MLTLSPRPTPGWPFEAGEPARATDTSMADSTFLSCTEPSPTLSHFTFLPLQMTDRAHHHDSHRHPRRRFLTLTSTPREGSPELIAEAPPRKAAPFLRLPPELRLKIYALLVLPHDPSHLRPSYEKVSISALDHTDHQKFRHNGAPDSFLAEQTLMIRTIDPARYAARYPALRQHTRKSYRVRADRMRPRCTETTYHCINNPRIEDNLAIMRTNTLIHTEVCELLYGHYTFDFDTHVEAVIPFLADLTPYARSCIRSLRVVKRALPYEKEFDRCEWSNAMRYLTTRGTNIKLRRLQLGVVAGRPGRSGWDRIPTYSARDFALLAHQGPGMEWMQYLLEITELDALDVRAVVEHCAPASSSAAMAHYVRFSASVETGFAEFLRSRLLAGSASEAPACRL